jgi:hypothetical protein
VIGCLPGILPLEMSMTDQTIYTTYKLTFLLAVPFQTPDKTSFPLLTAHLSLFLLELPFLQVEGLDIK